MNFPAWTILAAYVSLGAHGMVFAFKCDKETNCSSVPGVIIQGNFFKKGFAKFPNPEMFYKK